MHRSIITIARIALVLSAFAGAVSAANVDVRILIDVSGSMRKNDPMNLRIPAVRLVAELMPQGANAGIWMFSETVEQLIAPRKVCDCRMGRYCRGSRTRND